MKLLAISDLHLDYETNTDLITVTESVTMKGDSPDWWGEIKSVPTGLTEDRYVEAVEVREVQVSERTAEALSFRGQPRKDDARTRLRRYRSRSRFLRAPAGALSPHKR